MTLTIREKLEKREFDYLSDIATKSANSKGRKIDEPQSDLRTDFQRDRDRILHSKHPHRNVQTEYAPNHDLMK